MRLLLDTCSFLWLAGGQLLSTPAAAAVRDPSNEVFLSAVSVWEIASKHRAGRLPLPESPARLIPIERELRGVPVAVAVESGSVRQPVQEPGLAGSRPLDTATRQRPVLRIQPGVIQEDGGDSLRFRTRDSKVSAKFQYSFRF